MIAADTDPPDRATVIEEPLMTVAHIAVYDTTVQVSAAEPLAHELRLGLVNLAAAFASADRTSGSTSTHRLAVHRHGDIWTVRWDGDDSYRGPKADMALYGALIELNHHASRRATELGHAVLHGGAVAIAGVVVAVVGHSGAGKSTLTTALTQHGHPFVADEVVAVGDGLGVAPFHRPIGLRAGGAARLGVGVADGPYEQTFPYHVAGPLGGGEPLALVAILRRCDDPIDARFDDLTEAEALFALSNQTLGATEFERNVFRRLDRLVRRVRTVELHYHDVADAVALLETFAADHADRIR